jgi:peptide/nickel transport system substrate-binding protein
MMTWRLRTRLVLPLLLAVSWFALPQGAAAQGGTVRWGNNGEVSTMDPHGAFSTANAALLGNIYESLVRHDRNLRFEPALATGWTVMAPDHWRFAIRRGVVFHDGSPLTAADVVASLRRASVPNSPYAAVTHMIREVVQVDDATVDILLRGPYPVLINDLSGIAILSERWMAANDASLPTDPARGRSGFATQNTNGTGPFRQVSREADRETVLERFPGWWDRAEHPVERVVFRPVPNDATRVAGLLSGQLDIITPTPLQDADRLRRDANARLVEAQDLRVMFLGFNLASGHEPAGGGTNPLADRRVRRALAMGLDVASVTRTVMRGLTRPIDTLLAPEIGGYDPAQVVPRAPFDPEGAKRLLAEAGYPDGFAIGLDCPIDRFVNGERVCQAAAAMWARIGVRVSFNAMRYPAYMQRFLNNRSDIFILGWANTPQLDGFSILNNVFRTRDERSGSWNAGGVSDPAFDALTARIAVEMDPARRTALMTEAFAIEREAVWTIPLYREPMLVAMRRDLDIPASADGRVRFWLARSAR